MSKTNDYEKNLTQAQLMAMEMEEMLEKKLPQEMVKAIGLDEDEWFASQLGPKDLQEYRDAKVDMLRQQQQVAAIANSIEAHEGALQFTLEEIASKTGMSKERVRQVEQDAKRKMINIGDLGESMDDARGREREAPGEIYNGMSRDGARSNSNPKGTY